MSASFRTKTIHTISSLKSRPAGTVITTGTAGRTGFFLVCLTRQDAHDMHIIRILARWRKKHETWFPAQFPVTAARTKSWLETRVLSEPDRLLFMIQIHGTYRGHVGLYRFDFENKTCEIDNIVRGRSGVRGMMESAIQSMMHWGTEALGITGYTLQTTSDNVRAIALYQRLGFTESKRIALVYNKTKEGGEWTEAPIGHKGKIQRYDVFMENMKL